MGTKVRPEISEKSDYWIERHRYYELKHFCLQYPIWKKAYLALDGYCSKSASVIELSGKTGDSDPTAKYAESRLHFAERMRMVENAAEEAAHDLGQYIFMAVTEGLSYSHLKSRLGIPCCKETYYDLYRRFFWLLSKARN
jgi:hypothetical protein